LFIVIIITLRLREKEINFSCPSIVFVYLQSLQVYCNEIYMVIWVWRLFCHYYCNEILLGKQWFAYARWRHCGV